MNRILTLIVLVLSNGMVFSMERDSRPTRQEIAADIIAIHFGTGPYRKQYEPKAKPEKTDIKDATTTYYTVLARYGDAKTKENYRKFADQNLELPNQIRLLEEVENWETLTLSDIVKVSPESGFKRGLTRMANGGVIMGAVQLAFLSANWDRPIFDLDLDFVACLASNLNYFQSDIIDYENTFIILLSIISIKAKSGNISLEDFNINGVKASDIFSLGQNNNGILSRGLPLSLWSATTEISSLIIKGWIESK